MDYSLPEEWRKELDNHKITGLVSTDLSKAFDIHLIPKWRSRGMIWGEPRGNEASRARSNVTTMASFAYGPSYLSEEDIPGSSLNGRDPNRLKNSELQFWFKVPW